MEKLGTKIKKGETLFDSNNLIAYEKFSGGAFELHKDYIVFYRNLIPFRNLVKGRITKIISLKDIQTITYKGTGWFHGFLKFEYKHYNKPIGIKIFVWWVIRRKRFNINLTPIFSYLNNYIKNGWNLESYRKIETLKEVVEKGICPSCGATIEKDKLFCGACGYKLK